MQQNYWFYRLPPAGTTSLLQKRGRVLIARLPLRQKAIRHKNRKTNNVGAQRCVRTKTHTSKEQPGRHTGLPLLAMGKQTATNCRGAPMCAPKKHTSKESQTPSPCGYSLFITKRGRVLIARLPLQQKKQRTGNCLSVNILYLSLFLFSHAFIIGAVRVPIIRISFGNIAVGAFAFIQIITIHHK